MVSTNEGYDILSKKQFNFHGSWKNPLFLNKSNFRNEINNLSHGNSVLTMISKSNVSIFGRMINVILQNVTFTREYGSIQFAYKEVELCHIIVTKYCFIETPNNHK